MAFPSQLSFGMTLRDWFAGQYLTAIAVTLANCGCDKDLTASACYDLADAMLAAREEGGAE
jgi:hypothetical protein